MIAIFLFLFVGAYEVHASPNPCATRPSGTGERPDIIGEVTLCRQMNGFCYDDRCDNCTIGTVRLDLCGKPSPHKKCCLPGRSDAAVGELFGDPHVRTFDGLPYDFQREGQYPVTWPCSKNDWEILAYFIRPFPGAWWTTIENVTIALSGSTVIEILKMGEHGDYHVILELDIIIHLPYEDERMIIIQTDRTICVYLKEFGVQACFNLDYCILSVYVQYRWYGQLCGLLGNWNGDVTDDLDDVPNGPDTNSDCPPPRDSFLWAECKRELNKVTKGKDCRGVNLHRYLTEYVTDYCLEGEATANLTFNALLERCKSVDAVFLDEGREGGS